MVNNATLCVLFWRGLKITFSTKIIVSCRPSSHTGRWRWRLSATQLSMTLQLMVYEKYSSFKSQTNTLHLEPVIYPSERTHCLIRKAGMFIRGIVNLGINPQVCRSMHHVRNAVRLYKTKMKVGYTWFAFMAILWYYQSNKPLCRKI